MHRFFVSGEALQGDSVRLIGATAHQLTHVLRFRPGQRIVVLDDSGWQYTVELQRLGHDEATGCVVAQTKARGEPAVQITLYQALLKASRFEWVLQKGTELGIVCFVPMRTSRVVRRDWEGLLSKQDRWRSIIREAAEQSHRGRLPRLGPPRELVAACESATETGGLRLLPWEEETKVGLRQLLRPASAISGDAPDAVPALPTQVHIFIGPEGGFTSAEVELARQYGIRVVTLGPRILRAETAGLVAAAAILYELGDLA